MEVITLQGKLCLFRMIFISLKKVVVNSVLCFQAAESEANSGGAGAEEHPSM